MQYWLGTMLSKNDILACVGQSRKDPQLGQPNAPTQALIAPAIMPICALIQHGCIKFKFLCKSEAVSAFLAYWGPVLGGGLDR